MSDLEQTMRDLATMIDWYWSSGHSDQEDAVAYLHQALDSGQNLDLAGQVVYFLAGYYWVDGNRDQSEMLRRLSEIFGPRHLVADNLYSQQDLLGPGLAALVKNRDLTPVYNPS